MMSANSTTGIQRTHDLRGRRADSSILKADKSFLKGGGELEDISGMAV
jgi:hypothetical protein